ncbi:MAG: DUF4397 domain-containing protein [Phycisphaerales bacterium]|nr:DUF4397 domain-containing protein [Phycisphaerales bacterium]
MVQASMTAIGALAVITLAGAASAQVRVRAVHASPDAPTVNVIGSGGVLGAGTNVFPNLSFRSATAYAALPDGLYNVGVAPAPSVTTIYSENFTLTGPADVTVVARGLLGNNSFDLLPFVDDNTVTPGQARIRFIHASPNAPTVNINVAGSSSNIFSGVSFGESGGYITVPAGSYDLEVRLAANNGLALSATVNVLPGSVSTIFAMGLVGGSGAQALAAVPIVDVIPTPGATALLGLAGLMVARRRR